MDHKVSDQGKLSSSSIYGQEDTTLDIVLCIKEEQDEHAYLVPYCNLQRMQSISGHTGNLFALKEEKEEYLKNSNDSERFEIVGHTADMTFNIKAHEQANFKRPQDFKGIKGLSHHIDTPFSPSMEDAYFKDHQNSGGNINPSDIAHKKISIKEEGEAYGSDNQMGTECSTFTTDIPLHIKQEEEEANIKDCIALKGNKSTSPDTNITFWITEEVYINRPSRSEETESIRCITDIPFSIKKEEDNDFTGYVDTKKNESLSHAIDIRFGTEEVEDASFEGTQVSGGTEHTSFNKNICSSINEEIQDYVTGPQDWSGIERFSYKAHIPYRIKGSGMYLKDYKQSEITDSTNCATDTLFHLKENYCFIDQRESEWEQSVSSITGDVTKYSERKVNDSTVRTNLLLCKYSSGLNNTKVLQSSKKRKTPVLQNQEPKGVKTVYYENYISDSSFLNVHHVHSKINNYCDKYECENFQGNRTIRIRDVTTEQKSTLFSCPGCDKNFIEKRLLTRHQKEHTLGQLYQCSECERTFGRKGSLISHYRTHTGEKPHKCTECFKCFSRHANLINHYRTHTGEKPHQCTECEKAFTMKKDLLVHERTHTGERPFSCTECGKSFGRKDTLCKHERIHTGERPYQCIVCKERFSRQEALRSHEKICTDFEKGSSAGEGHAANRPYQCTECNMCFTQKCNLIFHQRAHSGERPYECSECQKRFSQKSCLITHYRTHTGEKPYQCSECHKRFSQKSCLSIHHRTHTGEKPYECSECQKRFSYKPGLFKHYEIHTGKITPSLDNQALKKTNSNVKKYTGK